jgi:hypothetical protein
MRGKRRFKVKTIIQIPGSHFTLFFWWHCDYFDRSTKWPNYGRTSNQVQCSEEEQLLNNIWFRNISKNTIS